MAFFYRTNKYIYHTKQFKMFFNRTCTIRSKKNADKVKQELVGKHVTVHNIDFEVFDKDERIRVIPHAEEYDDLMTLPITRINVEDVKEGSVIKISSHMRKIDVGGPLLLVYLIIAMIIVGLGLINFSQGMYGGVGKAFVGLALLISVIFWFNLEKGYFDYIKQIRKWIKSQVA
jgi:hypothetical protein